MKVEVVPAIIGDKPTLANLMQLYLYEFAHIDPQFVGDIQEDGRFVQPDLDSYWRDPGRQAFLIRADGRLAGFALIAPCGLIGIPGEGQTVAEFFVLSQHRRRRIGEEAARRLFDRFPGRWSVAENAANEPAQAFWRAVIDRYTQGNFHESTWGDHEAVLQTFATPARALFGDKGALLEREKRWALFNEWEAAHKPPRPDSGTND